MEKVEQTDVMRELALRSLTAKQKLILERGMVAEGIAISKFVNYLRQELSCADSTLWKSVRTLRKMQLLETSSEIRLTPTARQIIE